MIGRDDLVGQDKLTKSNIASKRCMHRISLDFSALWFPGVISVTGDPQSLGSGNRLEAILRYTRTLAEKTWIGIPEGVACSSERNLR